MSEFFLRSENPPSPDQVRSFARTCILFAHRHDQLRKRNGRYVIGPMAKYTPPDVVGGEPFGLLYEDAIKVYAKLDEVINVNIIRTITAREIHVVSEGIVASELRMCDTFKSINDKVTRSSRELEQTVSGVKQSGNTILLNEINLDNVQIPNNIAETIAWEDDCRELTEGDFVRITQDVLKRMHEVDSGSEFSQKRKNYMEHFQ